MRRSVTLICAAAMLGWSVLALAGTAYGSQGPAGTASSRLTVSWGKAREVPGIGSLNTGHQALVQAISCPAAGSCVAGGSYNDTKGHNHAFLATERKGKWGKARQVSGTAALAAGGEAFVTHVACPKPGYCSAVGTYIIPPDDGGGFVVDESNGKWGTAIAVPGLATLNKGKEGGLDALSCPSRGNCSAGGTYLDSALHEQGLVVSERHGKWGKAVPVPGLAALNKLDRAAVTSLSCTSAGHCAAVGSYFDASGHRQVFVLTQVNGKWGKARQAPGSATLNTGGEAILNSISCSTAGNCTAGGTYLTKTSHFEAMFVRQVKGTWRKAQEVPGSAALNTGNLAEIDMVSCAHNGRCSASGSVTDKAGPQGMVVSQNSAGTWDKAIKVPGLVALNQGNSADALALSCPAARDCSATGYYDNSKDQPLVFVVTELNGKWGKAIEVPAFGALNTGHDGTAGAIACASAGNCSAGGGYKTATSRTQAFVVNETAKTRKK